MVPWFKRASAPQPPILSRPWANSALQGQEVDVPRGKSRTVRRVQLTAAGLRFNLHPGELRDLANGRMNIVESSDGPDQGFLVRAGSVVKGAAAYPWVRDLQEDSLVLLVAPMTEPPPAVLAGEDAKRFLDWVDGLPS